MATGTAPRGKSVKSVLIIDLDAHCGGGTHSIIKNRENISQFDVSVSPFDSYNDEADRHSLHFVTKSKNYLQTIEDGLNQLKGFDLVLYNAGMDPHQGCIVGGLDGITTKMLKERERLVFDWCRKKGLPISFMLAGGYEGLALSKSQLANLHKMTVAEASK
jgi:acetoin utilization deacetylase AcuC-like enzyme